MQACARNADAMPVRAYHTSTDKHCHVLKRHQTHENGSIFDFSTRPNKDIKERQKNDCERLRIYTHENVPIFDFTIKTGIISTLRHKTILRAF